MSQGVKVKKLEALCQFSISKEFNRIFKMNNALSSKKELNKEKCSFCGSDKKVNKLKSMLICTDCIKEVKQVKKFMSTRGA
ncbi:hypothetical protein NSA45_15365 [Paraclostridium bifermentans]|uniref:hypothetical protein n=1 Tax=Paraclostridium bifermentans TaxID=1490 RepID=UPI00214A0B9A|nr:hypothetical protein [Paraclostridium bifermentans]MCR1877245.1 hypothetical protein [Paraclostridium bifermentans]